MYLRKLEHKDIPLMLEWMHDDSVVHNLYTDFASKTIEDVVKFIDESQDISVNMNLAVVSDTDEYMGTISLKHIDIVAGNAEFALTVRKTAMGQGYSWYGMKTIIQKAFTELALKCVYCCVSRDNERAVRFYDKHNFQETLDIPCEIKGRYKGVENLKWYSVFNSFDFYTQDLIDGCKVIHIKTIPTENAGELSFFEAGYDVPFDIKRLYYISKVPEGVRRGFHAHKELKQLLFCPYGKIKLILENADQRSEIELSNPSIGILIEKSTWREMLWMQKDSVLCVAASEYYEPEDYIRNYQQFIDYLRKNNKR